MPGWDEQPNLALTRWPTGGLKLHKQPTSDPIFDIKVEEKEGTILVRLVCTDGSEVDRGNLFTIDTEGIHLCQHINEKCPILLRKGIIVTDVVK
jgi:hypothetical protein